VAGLVTVVTGFGDRELPRLLADVAGLVDARTG
jgi:hypothetical protein